MLVTGAPGQVVRLPGGYPSRRAWRPLTVLSKKAEPVNVMPVIIWDRSTCCPFPVALRCRKAVKALFDDAKTKPVLLEPYMHVDIACPADSVGDVMGDLNSQRARVENMTTEGRRGKISASVPMNEILRYTNVLKSITSGRGSFTMRFDRYEEAPANIREQVSAAYQASLATD